MTVITQSFGYLGVIPTVSYGSIPGVFTLNETFDIREKIGASGAAFGFGATTKYKNWAWLKAGESRAITTGTAISIWLPPGATGSVSSYVNFSPTGIFNGQGTFTLQNYSTFVFSQNISGNYNPGEWLDFSISASTDFFAPQYALISGKFTQFSTDGGTISLV